MTVNRITDEIWEIPMSEKPGMLVPARIYATKGILAGRWIPGSVRSGDQCRLPARHSPVCALYAGRTLGLWISDRGCRGIRRAGRYHFSRRCGLRHQLRHAADSNRFDAGGCAASPGAAHDRTLSEGAGRRRGERIRSALGGGIWSRDDPWGQVVCGAGIRVASGSSSAWKKAAASKGPIRRS